MTEPLAPAAAPADASSLDDAIAAPHRSDAAASLRTRVVREARRETWFVVNEGSEDLDTIPLELRDDASLRRVDVNGEVAEFSADDTYVYVQPRRILRAGAGTLVVLHFR